MIDIRQLREDPDGVKAALGRRGVDPAEIDRVAALDAEARRLLAARETLRARVKALSRQVGQARRSGDEDGAARATDESRRLGDEESRAAADVEAVQAELRAALLDLPNLPAREAPDGRDADDNVEVRRWWPGQA